MTEFVLFCVVGLLAVAGAIAMLLSDNAVHSALFLIVTMGSIAFLFLLLNSPFLAMIQVTVYTGAIMVLFLFVIMLLGAEKLQEAEASPNAPRFRWYMPLTVGLVVGFFLIVGITLGQVNLNLSTNVAPQPQVRVLNAAPDAGTVDIYANDQLIASGLEFGQNSAYVSLAAGSYTLKVQPATGVPVTSTVSLQSGTQQTVVDYGNNRNLNVSVVTEDNSTITEDRSARLIFFNGSDLVPAVKLVDLGTSLDVTNAPVLVDTLKTGEKSSPMIVGENAVNWAFVDAANPQTILYRLTNYNIVRDTSGIVVLSEERSLAGATGTASLRATTLPIIADSAPAYGGPKAIGLELFTNYMLVFQLLAVLLLAAMIGAITLTHRQLKSTTRKVGGRRVVSRPLVSVIASQVGHDVTSAGEALPELQESAGSSAPVGK